MTEFFTLLLADHGLTALFVLSFLAATLLPLGSESLLVAVILGGHSPFLSVALATAGNTLGACTTYLIGIWGSSYLIHRILRINEKELERASRFYHRYGTCSLLFSWLPVLGDPLCLLGGIFRCRFLLFFALVCCGKLFRYALIAWGIACFPLF